MSRRQYRCSGLVAISAMLAMFAVVMTFYHDSPPPEPKQPCICREGLLPVTYDTPHGQQRVCLTSNSYVVQKAEGCEFTGEEEP